jgi:hypothetical protein
LLFPLLFTANLQQTPPRRRHRVPRRRPEIGFVREINFHRRASPFHLFHLIFAGDLQVAARSWRGSPAKLTVIAN